MEEGQQQQQGEWARIRHERLPSLAEVLSRKSRPPFDFPKFYLFLQRKDCEDILDFWLDVQQHENLCRAYFKDVQKSGRTICDDWPEYWKYARRRGSIYGTVVVTQTGAKHCTASTAEMTTEMQEKRGPAGRSPSPDKRAISPATAVGTDVEYALTSPTLAEPRSSTPSTLGKQKPLSFSCRTSRIPTIVPHGSPISRSDLVESAERIFLRYFSPQDAGVSHEIYLPPELRMNSFPLSNVTSSAVGRTALARVPDMFHAQKEYCFRAMEEDPHAFPQFLRSNAFTNLILMSELVRNTLLRVGSTLLRFGSGREDDDEHPQRSPYRLWRNSNLRNASYCDDLSYDDDLTYAYDDGLTYDDDLSDGDDLSYGDILLNGSRSSLDTIGPQRPPSFTLQKNDGLQNTFDDDTLIGGSSSSFTLNDGLRNTSDDDDTLIGGSSSSLGKIGPQRPPSPSFTLRRNDGLRNASDDDDTLIGGSSSTFDMIFSGVPYPSSTTLQSNGDLSNALFMTSPSDN